MSISTGGQEGLIVTIYSWRTCFETPFLRSLYKNDMLNHILQKRWKLYFIGFYYREEVFTILDFMVQRPINQSRPLFLSSYNGKGKTREGPFFKVQSGRITVCNVNQSFTISCYYFRIPSSKCFKELERDFLQMGPAASGPDLARTQSTTAQNDFHTAHNALMSLGEFDLTLNTGYFSFFLPTATCCCQPKSV